MSNEYSEKIKISRKKKGLTQTDLSVIIGKSLRMIQKYENGEVTPSIETLTKIAEALDVTVNDLLGYREATQEDIDNFDNLYFKKNITNELMPIIYDLYESIYNHIGFVEKEGLSAIEFLKKDKYLLTASLETIYNIIHTQITINSWRIKGNDNIPIIGDILIPYLYTTVDSNGAVITHEGSYKLGNKYNDINYLKFLINEYTKKIKELETNKTLK